MTIDETSTIEELFINIADRVSSFMGTPLNILIWIFIVASWIALFALHVLTSDSDILPSWFTSNAFNFPLNTVTTLAELYIGFLIAAAANRVEKRNSELHRNMQQMLAHIETLLEREDLELQSIEKDIHTSRSEGS